MEKILINEPCVFHVVHTQHHTAPHCTTLRHTATYCNTLRRRSDLKYLDLQIIRVYRIIRGLPFTPVKPCLRFWGLL